MLLDKWSRKRKNTIAFTFWRRNLTVNNISNKCSTYLWEFLALFKIPMVTKTSPKTYRVSCVKSKRQQNVAGPKLQMDKPHLHVSKVINYFICYLICIVSCGSEKHLRTVSPPWAEKSAKSWFLLHTKRLRLQGRIYLDTLWTCPLGPIFFSFPCSFQEHLAE